MFLVFLTFTSCGGSYPNSKTEEVASDDSNEEEEDQPKKKKKKSKKQVEEEEVYEEDAEESISPKKNNRNEITLEGIIGTWKEKEVPGFGEVVWTFNKNGTFTYKDDEEFTKGTYTLKYNNIYLKIKSTNSNPEDDSHYLKLVSVQENQIELLNSGAEVTLFRK